MPTAPKTADQIILPFRVGARWFGVPAESVRGVHRATGVTPLPGTASPLAGLMLCEGRIEAAIDLAALPEFSLSSENENSLAVITEFQGRRAGILADEVQEAFPPDPPNHGGITDTSIVVGQVNRSFGEVTVLSLAAIMNRIRRPLSLPQPK